MKAMTRWGSTSLLFLSLSSCAGEQQGIVAIDGSSTVFPISEAVAEEFRAENAAQVTIGVSGTGGGFQKFCRGEVDIANASRPVSPSEVELCEQQGISLIELPIAYDGIAVVVHPQNDWVDSMTVEELRALWRPEAQGEITRWNQIRSDWPDEEIHLFGPGVDSGTYDYFTEAIVGQSGASRGDYTSSEDDNVLVYGVVNDPLSLGYFGYAYYEENEDELKLVAVDDQKSENGEGAIAPSPETVRNGTYQPLSRPLFIYVRAEAAERPEVQNFVHFYLDVGSELIREVGYIGLPEKAYELAAERFEARATGSLFAGKSSRVGVTIEELLAEESK